MKRVIPIKCNLVISSSGKLTSQIKAGAPFDLFISANMTYPQNLYSQGYTTEKPSIYAYGKLVLWSMDSLPPSLKDLSASKIQHIAIANPKMAPYGIAAKELLKRIQLWDTIQHKLVYGESILQTNQFVNTNAAEVGFTSKSTVLNTQLKRTGTWTEIDPQLYPKIEQGVVILKSEVSKEKMASQFYEYLFSKEIQDLLLDYGYMITPNE